MKSQYELKVQSFKKRSKNLRKSIPTSDQSSRLLFLRIWIKIHSILTPKSVQEPPKIDPEAPSEPPRHHPDTKSLPKTSQEPPQTSQRPSQDRFRITFSSKNEPPNHNFRVRNFQFPKSIRRSLLSEAGGTGLAPLNPPPPASGRCTACGISKSSSPPTPPPPLGLTTCRRPLPVFSKMASNNHPMLASILKVFDTNMTAEL